MNTTILSDIALEFDLESLQRQLRVKNPSDAAELRRLALEAQDIARPKAAYRPVLLREVGEDSVLVDETVLSSRVLAVNLKDTHRVFLYMATCGTELNEWAHSLSDMVHQFSAEEIKVRALRAGMRTLNERIDLDFAPGKTTVMNPGSLADWPLSQQRPFFVLMDDAARALGVTLSDSCLMTPNKSVTGIRYELEGTFESCQLCPMPDCPGRRAPHDPDLYARRYSQGNV
ncbi:MAG: vitamin B12 dependent methionine synthase [Anaerolineae bacterium]